jgi:hypothetical protein
MVGLSLMIDCLCCNPFLGPHTKNKNKNIIIKININIWSEEIGNNSRRLECSENGQKN